MKSSVFLLCIFSLAVCSALNLPSYITPCRRDDPEFSKCALEHGNEVIPRITQGDPDYGIPVLDPLKVDEIQHYTYPKLNLTVYDIVLYGLKDVKLMSYMRSDHSANGMVFAERLRMTCKYSLSGELVGHNIEGTGETLIEFFDVSIPIHAELALSDREGYLSVKEVKAHVVPKKVTFKTTHFEGNQETLKLAEKSANENWEKMMVLLSPILDKMFSSSARLTAEAFFHNIPLNLIYT